MINKNTINQQLFIRVHKLIRNQNFNNNCLSQSGKMGDRYSSQATPHFCFGMPLYLGLIWFGTVVSVDMSSCLVKWGYKATLQLVAGVLLQLSGSTPHQGRWQQVIEKLDTEGYLPVPYPLWSCTCDPVPWVVMEVIQSTIQWHQEAGDIYTLCQMHAIL